MIKIRLVRNSVAKLQKELEEEKQRRQEAQQELPQKATSHLQIYFKQKIYLVLNCQQVKIF